MTRTHLVAAAVAAICSIAPSPGQTTYPKGVTSWTPKTTDNGLTLFRSPDSKVRVIGMNGRLLRTWDSPLAGYEWRTVEPLPNGNILGIALGAGPALMVEMDQNRTVVWSWQVPNGTAIHHDFARLANGNTLLLGRHGVTVPSISPRQLEDDCILEVDRNGKIVWSWFTWQHFNEFGFSAEAKQRIAAKGGDWSHTNAIDPLPANSHTNPAFRAGNIVVSQRFTNIIFIIDKTTGSVVWKSGPDNALTDGQHQPYMIPQGLVGAGNILVFNNGSGTGFAPQQFGQGYSSVIEIDPNTSTTPWVYTATMSGHRDRTFFSDLVSGAQRLSNGNTLVCSGMKGRLFEITRTGDIVWEYMSPYGAAYLPQQFGEKITSYLVYRAYRLPYSWLQ